MIAILFARGSPNFGSLEALRRDARFIRLYYENALSSPARPSLSCEVSYPGATSARVTLRAEVPGARSIAGVIRAADGAETAVFPLFDDGRHGDGLAGDGIHAGSWETARMRTGVNCDARVTDATGRLSDWPAGVRVPLAGPVQASLHAVESDHLNYDAVANPGENIRLSVTLENRTPFDIDNWTILHDGARRCVSSRIVHPADIPSSGSTAPAYRASNPDTYLVWEVDSKARDGDHLRLPIFVSDMEHNTWRDTLRLPVRGFQTQPLDSLTVHIAGPASGSLGWRAGYPPLLRNHEYLITVQGGDYAPKSVSVTDVTTGLPALLAHPLPDSLAHEVPVIDGWKLTNGTLFRDIADSIIYPDPVNIRVFSDPGWLQPLYNCFTREYGTRSSLTLFDAVPGKIVFDSVHGQRAYGYLYDPKVTPTKKPYMGYFPVAIRAYDMSDSTRPRQINLAFAETKGGRIHDSTWSIYHNSTDRDWLYVLKSTYTELPDPSYTGKDIYTDRKDIDIQYAAGLVKSSASASFANGDYFLINPIIPVSARDTFRLITTSSVTIESDIHLFPNYPNPVGSGREITNIPVSLRQAGRATVGVYSMLGKEMMTILDRDLEAGYHVIPFAPVLRSGVYFLELTAAGQQRTRRMIVLR